ncbi:hypothetical protein F383_31074 [Gossypium arboreum]|uniref:Uncharacterized protein n=1 Tax=Gossypium arboreum TaxID=29729 RepID=A0A0B0N1P0_GOSAR|nr:hypothetical protein F383_31074 [Gossypium arboreum]
MVSSIELKRKLLRAMVSLPQMQNLDQYGNLSNTSLISN